MHEGDHVRLETLWIMHWVQRHRKAVGPSRLAEFASSAAQANDPYQLAIEMELIQDSQRAELEAGFGEALREVAGDRERARAWLSSTLSDQLPTEMHRDAPEDLLATAMETNAGDVFATEAMSTPEDGQATEPGALSSLGDEASRTLSHSASGRYQRVRFHARGGLGQIQIAHDMELNRDVALKEIRPQYVESQASRARFVMEGEVTGRLEHPGVVPVYGMGVDPDGKPFYTMRFIRGESLTAAIRRYHTERAQRGDEDRIAFQQLLRRFVSVCQTLDYAHSRGVLHRDIKPDNIMLGRYGETLVVDWGLAKIIGRPERETREERSAEDTLHPLHDTDPAGTAHGSVAGTLLYMSPEQALGWHDRLLPSADVFSLGAVLFELLTGRTMVVAESVEEAQRKAIECHTPDPHPLAPKLSKNLSAIFFKSVRKDPTQRYQTAGELADDIEAFLADEPVSARQESILERAGRFSRKHRGWVSAATAAGLIGLIALSSVAWVLSTKNREIATKNEQITDQRDQANKNLELARNAVRDYLGALSRDERLQQAGLDKLRLELAQQAQPYYQEFLSADPDSEQLVQEQAEWQASLGQINYQAASRSQAYEHFAASSQAYARLLQSNEQNMDLRRAYIRSVASMALIEAELGRMQDAIEHFQVAYQGAQELPNDAEAAALASAAEAAGSSFGAQISKPVLTLNALAGLGNAYLATARFDQARSFLQQTIDYGLSDLARSEAGLIHPRVLQALLDLAALESRLGNYADVVQVYQRANQVVPDVDPQAIPEVELLILKASLPAEFGMHYMLAGEHLKALEQFEIAYAGSQEVAEKYPENLAARSTLSNAKNNLAIPASVIVPRDEDQERLRELNENRLRDARAEALQQLDENPDVLATRLNDVITRRNWAQFKWQEWEADKLQSEIDTLRADIEQIVADFPESWEARKRLAWVWIAVVDHLISTNQGAAAGDLLGRVTDECDRSFAETSDVGFLMFKADALMRSAGIAASPQEAIQVQRQRLELIDQLPPQQQQAASTLDVRSQCHEQLSYLLQNNGDAQEARQQMLQAMAVSDQVIKSYPQEPAHRMRRFYLSLASAYQAMAMQLGGDFTVELQEQVNASLEYVRDVEPRWIRTDIFEQMVPALEVMANGSLENEDYERQVRNLELAIRMLDEHYARTESKADLLRKTKLQIQLASGYYSVEQPDRFLPTLEQARLTAEAYLRLQPRSQTAKNLIAQTHIAAGSYYLSEGDDQAAYRAYDRAVELDPTDNYANARIYRAVCTARLGLYQTAAEQVRRLKLQEELDAAQLYDAACVFAQSYQQASRDETVEEQVRDSLRAAYLDSALADLRAALEGAEDAAAVVEYAEQDEDLESLREIGEYQALVREFGASQDEP